MILVDKRQGFLLLFCLWEIKMITRMISYLISKKYSDESLVDIGKDLKEAAKEYR